jgi:hypothetical protein
VGEGVEDVADGHHPPGQGDLLGLGRPGSPRRSSVRDGSRR